MNKEEMRIAIVKKCGWKSPPPLSTLCGWKDSDGIEMLSDPLEDLNAMHTAIELQRILPLGEDFFVEYCEILMDVCGGGYEATHATASKRAEAFCRVFWPEKFKD